MSGTGVLILESFAEWLISHLLWEEAPKELMLVGPVLVWGWLIGMNFLISISRFSSFIKKSIKKSGFKIVS